LSEAAVQVQEPQRDEPSIVLPEEAQGFGLFGRIEVWEVREE
jgi:hypothetical protein